MEESPNLLARRRLVYEACHNLALPASDQIEYLEELGVHNDELALDFDNAYEALKPDIDNPGLSIVLKLLNEELLQISGPDSEELWTDDAIRNSDQWRVIREYAINALKLMPSPSESASTRA